MPSLHLREEISLQLYSLIKLCYSDIDQSSFIIVYFTLPEKNIPILIIVINISICLELITHLSWNVGRF